MCLNPQCRPEGRRYKSVSHTGSRTDSSAPEVRSTLRLRGFVRQGLGFEFPYDAPRILAPDRSRFRSTQYRREILRELGSGHHVLAPCRARAFRQLRLHMREKRDHAPRVAWSFAKLLHGIESSLPRIQIHNHERFRVYRCCFQELLARRRRFQRDSRQFRRLEQFRLKKKIIDQYNRICHNRLSSQNSSLPMYHARRRKTSRASVEAQIQRFLCEPLRSSVPSVLRFSEFNTECTKTTEKTEANCAWIA